MFNQPTPSGCDADNIFPSPNGSYLVIQYDCHADQFALLLNLKGVIPPQPTVTPSVRAISTARVTDAPTPVESGMIIPRGYFLDWSPDGNWLLFRNTDTGQVSLFKADGMVRTTLENLPFGTYGATFSRDGQNLLTVASYGLGFGSEIGWLNLVENVYAPLYQFTDKMIAYPRWSPDGTFLAYILMQDSNTPFTTGELWLADPLTAKPLALLGPADAGHGYPPVWSPDSTSLVYVHRENPDSIHADRIAAELHSNLYQADVVTGAITPLTDFSESLVYDPVWSPDGEHLAFTANEAIWLLHLNESGSPLQVSQGVIARHPAWLVTPVIPQP